MLFRSIRKLETRSDNGGESSPSVRPSVRRSGHPHMMRDRACHAPNAIPVAVFVYSLVSYRARQPRRSSRHPPSRVLCDQCSSNGRPTQPLISRSFVDGRSVPSGPVARRIRSFDRSPQIKFHGYRRSIYIYIYEATDAAAGEAVIAVVVIVVEVGSPTDALRP